MSETVNALSFDVEDYFQVAAFAPDIARGDWPNFKRRVRRNTNSLLEMLARANVRATFYVLGWVGEHEPEVVREIADAGHEVASHGYSHQLVYEQSPRVFREETRRSRGVLEDLAQRPVTSYRAASYSITPKSLWALEILYEEGFRTDSSIFPIRHDRYGLTGGPLQPHHLDLGNGGRLLEFPISAAKVFGVTLPVSGGGYFRLYPYSLSRALAKRANREGRPFVFYLHPWEIDPDQPRVEASLLSRFRHYNNLHKTRPRLERLLDDFRFSTVSDCIAANYDENDLPVHRYDY